MLIARPPRPMDHVHNIIHDIVHLMCTSAKNKYSRCCGYACLLRLESTPWMHAYRDQHSLAALMTSHDNSTAGVVHNIQIIVYGSSLYKCQNGIIHMRSCNSG